jgi:hypothetical protein
LGIRIADGKNFSHAEGGITMLLSSPGFWSAMICVALVMWAIKKLWRIEKSVKAIEKKLNDHTQDDAKP